MAVSGDLPGREDNGMLGSTGQPSAFSEEMDGLCREILLDIGPIMSRITTRVRQFVQSRVQEGEKIKDERGRIMSEVESLRLMLEKVSRECQHHENEARQMQEQVEHLKGLNDKLQEDLSTALGYRSHCKKLQKQLMALKDKYRATRHKGRASSVGEDPTSQGHLIDHSKREGTHASDPESKASLAGAGTHHQGERVKDPSGVPEVPLGTMKGPSGGDWQQQQQQPEEFSHYPSNALQPQAGKRSLPSFFGCPAPRPSKKLQAGDGQGESSMDTAHQAAALPPEPVLELHDACYAEEHIPAVVNIKYKAGGIRSKGKDDVMGPPAPRPPSVVNTPWELPLSSSEVVVTEQRPLPAQARLHPTETRVVQKEGIPAIVSEDLAGDAAPGTSSCLKDGCTVAAKKGSTPCSGVAAGQGTLNACDRNMMTTSGVPLPRPMTDSPGLTGPGGAVSILSSQGTDVGQGEEEDLTQMPNEDLSTVTPAAHITDMAKNHINTSSSVKCSVRVVDPSCRLQNEELEDAGPQQLLHRYEQDPADSAQERLGRAMPAVTCEQPGPSQGATGFKCGPLAKERGHRRKGVGKSLGPVGVQECQSSHQTKLDIIDLLSPEVERDAGPPRGKREGQGYAQGNNDMRVGEGSLGEICDSNRKGPFNQNFREIGDLGPTAAQGPFDPDLDGGVGTSLGSSLRQKSGSGRVRMKKRPGHSKNDLSGACQGGLVATGESGDSGRASSCKAGNSDLEAMSLPGKTLPGEPCLNTGGARASGRPHETACELTSEQVKGKTAMQGGGGTDKDTPPPELSGERAHQSGAPRWGPEQGFDPDPAGPSFKYCEVVRGKEARENLAGWDCAQCRAFYDALSTWGAVVAGTAPVCGHVLKIPRSRGMDAAPVAPRPQGPDAAQLLQNGSRHRHRYAPPETPQGFWDLGFNDSLDSRW